MGRHVDFTIETDIPVYFCDPHSPSKQASGFKPNTNGLLRQYMPKGTDLSVHTEKDLARFARSLNDRPRMTLGYLKPSEKLRQTNCAHPLNTPWTLREVSMYWNTFRSIDNGTYALRKSRAARLERRTYSATWLPCRDSVPSSNSRSDRRTRQMRQTSDHSSRNRRKADSSQPLGSWKSSDACESRGRTLATHRPTMAYRGTRPCLRAQAEGRVWRGSCRRQSTRRS